MGKFPGENFLGADGALNDASAIRGLDDPKITLTAGAADLQEGPIDRAQWRGRLKAIGRVEKDAMLAATRSLALPCLLPAVRRDLRQSLATLATQPLDTVELLYQDPAIAPAVLGMVNPSTQREPICDLLVAAQRMGRQGVDDAIDINEMDALQPNEPAQRWLVNWWCHSMAVAHLSGVLSVAGGVDAATARMAGLMHDIGKLVLLSTRYANKLLSAYELSHRLLFSTTLAESSLLGMDHLHAGVNFCAANRLPAVIREACQTHDLDDAMRDQLPEADQRLGAVVAAANEIAKAVGMGCLPGDEIRPLPVCMANAVTELSAPLESAVAEVQTLCHWRVGHNGVLPLPESAQLKGRLAVLVSASAGPWHPIHRLLLRAGARVIGFKDVRDVIESRPMSDVMLLDFSDASLHLSMPVICRLGAMDCFRDVPKLLLARRAEDPQGRVRQTGLDIDVFPTPIRAQALLQAVRALTD